MGSPDFLPGLRWYRMTPRRMSSPPWIDAAMTPEDRVQGLHTFSKADSQSQGQDSQELRYKFIAVSAHTFSSSHPKNGGQGSHPIRHVSMFLFMRKHDLIIPSQSMAGSQHWLTWDLTDFHWPGRMLGLFRCPPSWKILAYRKQQKHPWFISPVGPPYQSSIHRVLKQEKFIFSQAWRLEVWDQGVGRDGFSWGLSPPHVDVCLLSDDHM